MSFLLNSMTAGKPESSKRLIVYILVAVQVTLAFVELLRKVAAVNQELYATSKSNLFWLTIAFGGLYSAQKAIDKIGSRNVLEGAAAVKKAEAGTQDVNIANVEEQTVTP